MFKKIIRYFQEVYAQLKKVEWISFRDSMRFMVVVIVITVVLAAFLGGSDFVLTLLLNKLIK